MGGRAPRVLSEQRATARRSDGTGAQGLVSRALPVQTASRNCMRDEGGPFGFGDQVADPSHRNGRSLTANGRRQLSTDDTSRMMREYQVRICEGLGVKFPGPTRQLGRSRRAARFGKAAPIRSRRLCFVPLRFTSHSLRARVQNRLRTVQGLIPGRRSRSVEEKATSLLA